MAVRDIIQAAGGSAATSAAVYVEDVFSTYSYSGTGASQTITNGIDLSTKGGMVWTKLRSGSLGGAHHALYDTARGANQYISSSQTLGNFTTTDQITAFNTTGYALGGDASYGQVNYSAQTYASWTFRKQAKFFDVVTYTGTGSATTIAHSLGVTPGMIIVKRTDTTADWRVWHKSNGAGTNGQNELKLNTTDALLDQGNFPSAPTSTYFTVGLYAGTNASGGTYVAYLFADSNSGGFGAAGTDSVVACGSFTGNGVDNGGPIVNLGWEPQWLLIKATGSTTFSSWVMLDNMRGFTADAQDQYLYANTSDAEQGPSPFPKITATGFQPVHTSIANASGINYIYLAIRRGPMKTPTDATKVFAPSVDAPGDSIATGFPADFVITKNRTFSPVSSYVGARLTGPQQFLATASTDAETNIGSNVWSWDLSSTFKQSLAPNPASFVFRRAPGFFDVVCYTGTGSATTVAHNLGVTPELIIVKGRNTSATNWCVYSQPTGNTKYLYLNSTAAADVFTMWNNTSPTASVFSMDGTGSQYNGSGYNYVAYLFATCPGVSKVGTFTINASDVNVDCGFAAGARFVLIKRTDNTGSWLVFDTARGITSGNDPLLMLNLTNAELTGSDWITPYSAGFTAKASMLGSAGATYIYLAIA